MHLIDFSRCESCFLFNGSSVCRIDFFVMSRVNRSIINIHKHLTAVLWTPLASSSILRLSTRRHQRVSDEKLINIVIRDIAQSLATQTCGELQICCLHSIVIRDGLWIMKLMRQRLIRLIYELAIDCKRPRSEIEFYRKLFNKLCGAEANAQTCSELVDGCIRFTRYTAPSATRN